jgi:hypothetical protein
MMSIGAVWYLWWVVGYENIYKTLRCKLGSKPKIVQVRFQFLFYS